MISINQRFLNVLITSIDEYKLFAAICDELKIRWASGHDASKLLPTPVREGFKREQLFLITISWGKQLTYKTFSDYQTSEHIPFRQFKNVFFRALKMDGKTSKFKEQTLKTSLTNFEKFLKYA